MNYYVTRRITPISMTTDPKSLSLIFFSLKRIQPNRGINMRLSLKTAVATPNEVILKVTKAKVIPTPLRKPVSRNVFQFFLTSGNGFLENLKTKDA